MHSSNSHLTAPVLARLLAILCLFTTTSLSAREDRWFRVELLVFSHESAQPAEQWDATPTLAYPGAARFLIDPDRVAKNASKHRGDSVVDEFGRQILTDKPGPAATAPALLPTPFVTLAAGQREFRGKAAYMQRSGRYRTLFHETWVQPVQDQATALPIVLDTSGDTGDWPRLQGSVTIYLSRYLHLKTNLWLNTSGEYLDGVWRMPAPPLGPPSLIIEGLSSEEEELVQVWSTPVAGGAALPVGDEKLLGPVYPYRHAVLLQQERRMRSTEVHYIDHPKLVVVIKITPVTEEELETMALAQANGSGI